MEKKDEKRRNKTAFFEGGLDEMIATYTKTADMYIKQIESYTKELQKMPKEVAKKECRESLIRSGVLNKEGRPHKIVK